MSIELTPSCQVVRASSTSPLDRVIAITAVVENGSAFTVDAKNDDTASSGDYGMIASPADSGESWQIGLKYDSGTGTARMALDPDGTITDALAPFSSASNKVSPNNAPVIPGSGTTGNWNTAVLFAEWPDAMMVLFQSSSGSLMPWAIQAGRIMAPRFGNDATSRALDGLGILRGSSEFSRFDQGSASDMIFGDTNATTSRVRVAESTWFSPGAAFGVNGSGVPGFVEDGRTGFGSWQTPSPVPLHSSENWSSGNGGGYLFGTTKYLFCWGTKDSVFTRLQGGSDGGLMYVGDALDPSPILVPWDFDTSPSP